MRKVLLLVVLFTLTTLVSAQVAHAQATGTVTLSGQFTAAVWGFAPVTIGTTSCQPGPSPAFQACGLPVISLGTPYSVTLATVGPKTSVTCTVSGGTLPSWLSLTSSGTSCVLSGTPTATGALTAFTITFTGS
jgi:hypothetical protein